MILTNDVLEAMMDISPANKFVDDPNWTTERAIALVAKHEKMRHLLISIFCADQITEQHRAEWERIKAA